MSDKTTERQPDVATIKVTLTFDPDGVKIETEADINEDASEPSRRVARGVIRAIQRVTRYETWMFKADLEAFQEITEGEVTHE